MNAISSAHTQAIEDLITKRKAESDERRRKHNREKAKHSPRGRYLHPKPKNLVVRLLDLIEERGGMTHGQMAKQLWQWSHPDIEYDPKKGRGRWDNNLYGRESLLHFFCKKVGKKWVRNGVDHEGQPWRVLRSKVRQRSKWQAPQWVNTNGVVTLLVQANP